MDDSADFVHIKISDRYKAFGYPFSENYDSYDINLMEIKPSEVTKIMESLLFGEDTRISEWFNTEEIYRKGYEGASGGGFEYILNVSSGIAANFITELLKRIVTKIIPREENYSIEKALDECYQYLFTVKQIKKSSVTLYEQNVTMEEYLFIFKHKKFRRYFVFKLSKRYDIFNFRVCNSLKKASE